MTTQPEAQQQPLDYESYAAAAEEQRSSDSAEAAVATAILLLLLGGTPPEAISRTVVESVVGSVLTTVTLSALMTLLARSGRGGDLTDWTPTVDQARSKAVDVIMSALAGRAASEPDSDAYARDVTGPDGASQWAQRVSETVVTTAIEDAKASAAARLGYTDKRWVTRLDQRVRRSHRLLEGVTVPLDGYFITSSNAAMTGPHDHAAPMQEWINCRCRLLYVKRGTFNTVPQ